MDFVDTIKNINWDNILLCSDVDIAWATWKNLFLKACNMHAPYKEKRIKGSLPEWINGDYLKTEISFFQKHIRQIIPKTGKELNH